MSADVVLQVVNRPVQLQPSVKPVQLIVAAGRGGDGLAGTNGSDGEDGATGAPADTGIQFFIGSKPLTGELLLRLRARGSIPLDVANFVAGSEVGATSDAAIVMKVNGVTKVTLTYPGSQQAGSGVGTWDIAMGFTGLEDNDLVQIYGPDPQDATLRDLDINMPRLTAG